MSLEIGIGIDILYPSGLPVQLWEWPGHAPPDTPTQGQLLPNLASLVWSKPQPGYPYSPLALPLLVCFVTTWQIS